MTVDRGRIAPVWKIIEPPFTQSKPRTVFQVPHGARFSDLLTPQQTIQVLGSSRAVVVPASVDVYMGATQAHIRDNGKTITFSKNPVKDGVPKEMLVKDGSVATFPMDDESLISGSPATMGVNRATMPSTKPMRKVVSNRKGNTAPVLQGIRA